MAWSGYSSAVDDRTFQVSTAAYAYVPATPRRQDRLPSLSTQFQSYVDTSGPPQRVERSPQLHSDLPEWYVPERSARPRRQRVGYHRTTHYGSRSPPVTRLQTIQPIDGKVLHQLCKSVICEERRETQARRARHLPVAHELKAFVRPAARRRRSAREDAAHLPTLGEMGRVCCDLPPRLENEASYWSYRHAYRNDLNEDDTRKSKPTNRRHARNSSPHEGYRGNTVKYRLVGENDEEAFVELPMLPPYVEPPSPRARSPRRKTKQEATYNPPRHECETERSPKESEEPHHNRAKALKTTSQPRKSSSLPPVYTPVPPPKPPSSATTASKPISARAQSSVAPSKHTSRSSQVTNVTSISNSPPAVAAGSTHRTPSRASQAEDKWGLTSIEHREGAIYCSGARSPGSVISEQGVNSRLDRPHRLFGHDHVQLVTDQRNHHPNASRPPSPSHSHTAHVPSQHSVMPPSASAQACVAANTHRDNASPPHVSSSSSSGTPPSRSRRRPQPIEVDDSDSSSSSDHIHHFHQQSRSSPGPRHRPHQRRRSHRAPPRPLSTSSSSSSATFIHDFSKIPFPSPPSRPPHQPRHRSPHRAPPRPLSTSSSSCSGTFTHDFSRITFPSPPRNNPRPLRRSPPDIAPPPQSALSYPPAPCAPRDTLTYPAWHDMQMRGLSAEERLQEEEKEEMEEEGNVSRRWQEEGWGWEKW